MWVVRATIVWWVGALLLALAPGLEASAQDKPKIEVVPSLGHSAQITAAALSPDGRLVLSGSWDNTIKLWEVETGHLVRSFVGHSSSVLSVAFSPDGSHVLAGGYDEVIRMWEAETGRMVRTFKGHRGQVFAIALSRDGRFLASGGGDSTIRMWDLSTGQLIRTLWARASQIYAVSFSPDGSRIISGDVNNAVKLWDAGSGELVRTLQGHQGFVQSTVFLEEGARALSSSDDGTLRIWELETGASVGTIATSAGSVKAVALLSSAAQVISGGKSGRLQLWDLSTGRLVRSFEGHAGEVSAVHISPNGLRVISASVDKTIKVWDIATGRLVRTIEGRSRPVNSLAVLFGANRLIAGSADSTIKLWDLQTGELLKGIKGHASPVNAVTISTDETQFYSSAGDYSSAGGGELRMWDAGTGQLMRTPTQRLGGLYSLAASPNASLLLSGGYQPDLQLWDTLTGAHVRTFSIQGTYGFGPVSGVAFSPDGTKIAAGGALDLRLWEVASGHLIHTFRVPFPASFQSVAFSPDGTQLAGAISGNPQITSMEGGEIRLWDLESRSLLRVFEGHTASVNSVVFSPNDATILSGSHDSTVKLWKASTGELLRTYEGHVAGVKVAAFTKDGNRILSTGLDGTIRIWEVEGEQPIVALVADTSGEWLALTPEGFFSSSANGHTLLTITRGLASFGIDQFYQTLYRPDLVQEKLAGDPNGKVREAAAKLDLAKLLESGRVPAIRLISHQAQAVSLSDLVTVEANLADQGGGVGRAEWRINGITIGVVEKPTSSLKQAVALDPGENVVELIAYNGANLVSSRPAQAKITWNGAEPTARPRLFVLVAGINQYVDGDLKLSYAVPDAKAIAAAFEAAGREHYEEVSATFALDGDATIAGLDRIFAELAGRVRPRDVFVFFAAAHGKTIDGRYYMLPQDLIYQNEQSLVRSGIGQAKLQEWFAKIAAKKAVLLFDTCEAGSLTTGARVASRGLEQKAALGRLIQATGRATLTATTATQDAWEGYGNHGVFTFAILDALARGDTNGNGLIELAELIQHLDGLVPAIAEKLKGAKQFPQMDANGSNFSLVRQVASLAPAQGEVMVIPIKPTHVNTELLAIFKATRGSGGVVKQLPPFTSVTVVKTESGWVLIAKDGIALGYVAESKLRRLN